VGLQLEHDAAPLAALFLFQRACPARPSRGAGEGLRDLEVVETSESALERAKRRRGGYGGLGRYEREGEVGQVPPVTHPDPEAVEPTGGRLAPRPSVGRLYLPPALVPDLREIPFESLHLAPVRLLVQCGSDPFEQPRIPFRTEDDPQEFAADARVVDESGADLVESDPFLRAAGQGAVREQAERDVPVPDATDEPGEAFEPPIIPLDLGARSFRQKSGPDLDPDAEAAQVAVKSMQGGSGRARIRHQSVEFVQRRVKALLESLNELLDGGGRRARAHHGISGKFRTPAWGKTVSQPFFGHSERTVLEPRPMSHCGAVPVCRDRW
jgi:hypothetical protein